MKKFLILTGILISIPVFASCSIDGNMTCSLTEFHQEDMNPTYSPQSLLKEYSGTPEARLKPAQNRTEKDLRDFGAQPSDYSYNTSCQFGVCNTTGVPRLFEQRGD